MKYFGTDTDQSKQTVVVLLEDLSASGKPFSFLDSEVFQWEGPGELLCPGDRGAPDFTNYKKILHYCNNWFSWSYKLTEY